MAITQRTCNTNRMNVYRLAARYLVLFGGLFWAAVVLMGALKLNSNSIFDFKPVSPSLDTALAYSMSWIVVAAVVFVIGLFWERIAAVLLVLAAVGSIAFGVYKGWESGMWIIMLFFIIGPVITSAVLYWMAAREQSLCEDTASAEARKPGAPAAA
jgi:predicted anti-sigma-YlaC factor YlaD